MKLIMSEYQIFLGDILIGYASDVYCDMPNIIGMFKPTAAFDEFKPLFDLEYACLTGLNPRNRREVMDEIFAKGLHLVNPTTGMITKSVAGKMPEITFQNELAYLHINGDKVWWRLM